MSKETKTLKEAARQKQELFNLRKAAYYSSLLEGFHSSRANIDLNIMLLSGGGIGLIVTLLTTGGKISPSVLALGIVAVVFFIVCIAFVLSVLKLDSKYMILLATRENEDSTELECETKIIEKRLKLLDFFAQALFFLGIIVSLLFAILRSTSFVHYNIQGEAMSNEGSNPVRGELLQDSKAQLSDFRPVDSIRSQTGISGMKPQPPAPTEPPKSKDK